MEEYYVDHYEFIPVPTPSTLSEEDSFSKPYDYVIPLTLAMFQRHHTSSKTENAMAKAMDNLNTVFNAFKWNYARGGCHQTGEANRGGTQWSLTMAPEDVNVGNGLSTIPMSHLLSNPIDVCCALVIYCILAVLGITVLVSRITLETRQK